MKNRWVSALLAFLLAASLLPAPARAASDTDGSAGSRLTGKELEIYECLRAGVADIAKGARTSTDIYIPDTSGLSWTIEELDKIGNKRGNTLDKLREALLQTVDLKLIFNCLAVDCPYDLFWKNNQLSWDCTFSQTGDVVAIKTLTIRLGVSPDYRGGGPAYTNPSKIAAANEVVEYAQTIVDRHRDESDFEKLVSYREEICALTAYNVAAATDAEMPYGNPWQMIYVFDGDPGTNVVCEGYAKAFKYLCDLSEFNGNVVCRIATGTMNGGSHMWNVVQMGDGKNYLADVTNCDSGTIGADDKLFLAGASVSDNGRTYTVSKERCRAVYTYDDDQAGLFTDGWLALSGTDYVDMPGAAVTADPTETEAPARISFSDVPQSQYYAGPVAWAVEQEIAFGTSNTTFSPDQPCTHAQILTFLWRSEGKPASSWDISSLPDVDQAYAEAVRWAAELGMLEENFDPEAGCSRAEAMRYIWRAFDGPDSQVASFEDLPADSPYAHAVGWAVLEGVTNGATDTTFEPDAICSRGQIITFLYRAWH